MQQPDFIEYQPLIISGLTEDTRWNGTSVYFVKTVSPTHAKVIWCDSPTCMTDIIRRDVEVPIANLRYSKKCPEGHVSGASCLRCKGVGVVECGKEEQEFDLRLIHKDALKRFVRDARAAGYTIPD